MILCKLISFLLLFTTLEAESTVEKQTQNEESFLNKIFFDYSNSFLDKWTEDNVNLPNVAWENRRAPATRENIVVEPPLLVGSFNIQTLGKKKFSDSSIMSIVEKIILRYDLILIMEIMTKEPQFLEKLLTDINSFGPQYNMTKGENHPSSMEQYAYFYRTDKLTVLKSESYVDPIGNFYRQPLVAMFSSPTLRDMTHFVVIGHHVKPDQAVRELNALADLHDFVKIKYNVEDILLMGDFNADCTYVKETDWQHIYLWIRSEFTWVIGDHVDTTTNYRSCALDRFVYAGENMNEGVIMESAKIFNFQEAFELTTSETRSISDHWPIELKIRGKLSHLAEKHLNSDVCFKVQDARFSYTSKDAILRAASTAFFTVTVIPDGYILSNESSSVDDVIASLENVRKTLSTAVTHELYHAVLYKLEHGSLNDDSSYFDIEDPTYKVEIILLSSSSTVSVCKRSSIN